MEKNLRELHLIRILMELDYEKFHQHICSISQSLETEVGSQTNKILNINVSLVEKLVLIEKLLYSTYVHQVFNTSSKPKRSSTNDYTRNRFDKYNGPSDGYGGALSDDFIDDALSGDPDAIWNID